MCIVLFKNDFLDAKSVTGIFWEWRVGWYPF